jgi:hypothetical protein
MERMVHASHTVGITVRVRRGAETRLMQCRSATSRSTGMDIAARMSNNYVSIYFRATNVHRPTHEIVRCSPALVAPPYNPRRVGPAPAPDRKTARVVGGLVEVR